VSLAIDDSDGETEIRVSVVSPDAVVVAPDPETELVVVCPAESPCNIDIGINFFSFFEQPAVKMRIVISIKIIFFIALSPFYPRFI
jgi:hypothetical protein